MKLLISFIILLSLVFLFGGLFAVGAFSNQGPENGKPSKISETVLQPEQDNRLSMKQIDSLTSTYNYPFTSANAAGSSVYSVTK